MFIKQNEVPKDNIEDGMSDVTRIFTDGKINLYVFFFFFNISIYIFFTLNIFIFLQSLYFIHYSVFLFVSLCM